MKVCTMLGHAGRCRVSRALQHKGQPPPAVDVRPEAHRVTRASALLHSCVAEAGGHVKKHASFMDYRLKHEAAHDMPLLTRHSREHQ